MSWNATTGASRTPVQEADTSTLASPTTEVDRGASTSWATWGNLASTYYYRVKATNGYGNSAWSNLQSAVVAPPLPKRFDSTADATIAQGVPDFNGGTYDDILVG